ncbi:hypothetical protein PG987_003126 [Apiospora arundinis]|uniref:Uncharacterized protein n=1 Tax=Apiospora arundinis TaxID=335852 RepID=A0ABR2HZ28_9PEZI
MISYDRRQGLVPGTAGRGDSSIVLEVWIAALGLDPTSNSSTKYTQRHARLARRWACLAGPTEMIIGSKLCKPRFNSVDRPRVTVELYKNVFVEFSKYY